MKRFLSVFSRSRSTFDKPQTRSFIETLEPRMLFSATLLADAGPDLLTDEGSAIIVEGTFEDTNTGTPGEFEVQTLPSSPVRTAFAAHSVSGDNVIWYDTTGNVFVFDGTTDTLGNPNIVDLTALSGGSISTSGYSVDADGDRVAFNNATTGVFVYDVGTQTLQQVGSGGSSITNVQINGDYVTWQKSASGSIKSFIYDLSNPSAGEQFLANFFDLGGAGAVTGATVSGNMAYWIGAGGVGGFSDVFAKNLDAGVIFNASNTAHNDQNISADGQVVAWNAQTSTPTAYIFDGRGYDGASTPPAAITLSGRAGDTSVRPSVSGANVAFESSLGSRDVDIFVYNLDTEIYTAVTTNGSGTTEQYAVIEGNNVTWENTVGSNTDVVIYDLSTNTETLVSTDGVRDYKPQLSGGNVSFVSGSASGGALTFAQGTSDATYTIDWDFGDGTILSDASLNESHTYLDNGIYTVTLTITSSNGDVATDTSQVTVNNVAPIIDALSLDTATVDEGGEVTLNGTFTDAGILDTHTVAVTWGDGTTSDAFVDASTGTFSATHTYLDDAPTGTPSDLASIAVTLTDKDGGEAIGNETVTVNNLAPVVGTVTGPSAAVRGQTLRYTGTFSDAGVLDTHSENWTVTDSSGTVIATGSGSSFEYTPSELGNFTITYSVTDDDTGTGESDALLTTSLILVTTDPIDLSQTTLFIGGSDGDDRITVGGRSSGLKASIRGGDGIDAVESGIQADRIVIYGNDGNDSIKVFNSAGDRPAELFGGAGNDWIRSGKGDDTIVGGEGNDFIAGHDGRDVLIGGEGSDLIIGHREDDILISGTYTGQQDLASLRAIMAAWTTSDSYTSRVASLSSLLNDSTVSDDDSFDLLLGLQGQDYFMYNDNQDLTDQRRNELMTDTENNFLDSEIEE